MNVIKTEIPDVLIFEPKVFGDERGFFFESFNHRQFEDAIGRSVQFVQDNHLPNVGELRRMSTATSKTSP
jgi:dTDP-4-dehydrorhamnose 3,5-epimerase